MDLLDLPHHYSNHMYHVLCQCQYSTFIPLTVHCVGLQTRQYFITLSIWVFIPLQLTPLPRRSLMLLVTKIWYLTAEYQTEQSLSSQKNDQGRDIFNNGDDIALIFHCYSTLSQLNQFISSFSLPLYSGLWGRDTRRNDNKLNIKITINYKLFSINLLL